MSVRMWTEENPDSWYHYQEYGNLELNDPPPSEDDLFCWAIQTDWQLEMMVRHSHRSELSIGATFCTNSHKVFLFATQFSLHNNCVLIHSLLLYFSKMKLDLYWISQCDVVVYSAVPSLYRNNILLVGTRHTGCLSDLRKFFRSGYGSMVAELEGAMHCCQTRLEAHVIFNGQRSGRASCHLVRVLPR